MQSGKYTINTDSKKDRFAFGDNWSKFLKVLDEERVKEAEVSLLEMLDLESLKGKNFLDIGSGSGLFSLAAYRQGANVCSFDYDIKSVKCTEELKRRYYDDERIWDIYTGDVLDRNWLLSLGKWDIVYSWGVLHHTGAMWDALANVAQIVKPGGLLFIAIYNDQGLRSKIWTRIKRTYNRGHFLTKSLLLFMSGFILWGGSTVKSLLLHHDPFYWWKDYKKKRGMSPKYDLSDWVGGYPFEVAKPEEIFSFFYRKNFQLIRLVTCGGRLGCNQFVFIKSAGEREDARMASGIGGEKNCKLGE